MYPLSHTLMREVFFLALSQSLTSFPQISQTFPVAASTKIRIDFEKNENFPPSYIAKNGVSRFLFYIDTWVPYFSCWEGQNTRGFVEVYCTCICGGNKVCNALVWVYDGSGWLGLVLGGRGGGARGQYLINLNLRLKVKINQVPGGTFLKRSGPLARIKIKGKSHGVWWTMHSFNFNEWSKSS